MGTEGVKKDGKRKLIKEGRRPEGKWKREREKENDKEGKWRKKTYWEGKGK